MKQNILIQACIATLLLLSGCQNDTVKPGETSDYEYSFTVHAISGEVHISYLLWTDGSTVVLNNKDKSEKNPAEFETRILPGKILKYSFVTKNAKSFRVKVSVSPNAKGEYLFVEKVNGKVVRKKKESFDLGSRDEASFSYNSSRTNVSSSNM